jgi:hypothetical protein
MFASCIFLEISRSTITCSSKTFFSVARGWPLGQVYQQTATLHETDAHTRQVKCLEGMRSPVYIALYVGQSALKFE